MHVRGKTRSTLFIRCGSAECGADRISRDDMKSCMTRTHRCLALLKVSIQTQMVINSKNDDLILINLVTVIR
jgi:hypothetical protein